MCKTPSAEEPGCPDLVACRTCVQCRNGCVGRLHGSIGISHRALDFVDVELRDTEIVEVAVETVDLRHAPEVVQWQVQRSVYRGLDELNHRPSDGHERFRTAVGAQLDASRNRLAE